jgi:tetratricopeptide (TPR) repeat protein
MFIMAATLTLALLLAGPTAQQVQNPDTSAQAKRLAARRAPSVELTKALGRMRVGDLASARGFLEQALAKNPNDMGAQLFLVELDLSEKSPDLQQVEAGLRRLYEMNPDAPEPLIHLARTLLDREQLDRAEAVVHDAIDAFPDRPELLHLLGTVRVRRGELDAGLRLLQEAAEAAPANVRIQRDLGLALVEKGLNGRALMVLGDVRDQDGRDPRVRRALASLYRTIEDAKHAEIEEREAERLEEGEKNAGIREENRRALSRRILTLEESARGSSPPEGAFAELWNLYQRRGDMAWNLPRMEELARKQPESTQARTALGRVLLARGEMEEAEKTLLAVVEELPDDNFALNGLFLLYTVQEKLPRLLELAERAVKERPDSSHAHLYLGRARFSNEQYEDATPAFRRALELAPDDLDVLLGLANHLRHFGGPAEANSLLVRALVVGPDVPRVYTALGLAAFEDGDDESAWSYLTQAENLGGRHPEIFWKLGTLHSRAGRGDDAWSYYTRAKELSPGRAAPLPEP